MEARSGPGDGSAPGAPTDVVAPPRQRWRLVLARAADAPRLSGRELVEGWDAALEASGLPIHRTAGRARPRIMLAAPLPLGMGAEHELAEVFLVERVPLWRARESLVAHLPAGWELIDLFDVWVGGPPLAGRVTGAEYRVIVGDDLDVPTLRRAAGELLAAGTLPRTRPKGETHVPYDLRPLLWSLAVSDVASPPVLRMRTRIHPELGSGRPEEVIAALGEHIGRTLDVESIVRERIILAGEDQAREEFDG